MLKFFDTLGRQKKEFILSKLPLKMYVCGPTVYDRIHIGNARPLVVFDVLYRLLRLVYGVSNVVYVRNITDIEDKIIARAQANGEAIEQLIAKTSRWFKEDASELHLLEPTFEPKATDNIPQILALIKKLLAKGLAYPKEGDVFFSVNKDPHYGRIADFKGRKVGARVNINQKKAFAQDFVLWKGAKAGEPYWDSPWGPGRPGWHIECSAMVWHYLGEVFDIHGGGEDLIFPHHENEMAQTCGCFGEDSGARFWLHNSMVTIEGQKMAKSAGNFITLRDALDRYSGELIRYWILSTHYRGVLAWKEEVFTSLAKVLSRWRKLARASDSALPLDEKFLTALKDDLNTPLAFTRMHELEKDQQYEQLFACGRFLGLFNPHSVSDTLTSKVQELLEERQQARINKDYTRADKIRAELDALGVILEDKSDSTTIWYLKDGEGT